MENRRKVLSVCVALALGGKVYAEDLPDTRKPCPQNLSSLSQSQKDTLPDECKNEHWGWATGGVAALLAAVAIGVHNNGGDADHHHTPVTPPDDGGGTDDGGDVTPPDDGGGTDDGGDVTPPDDGGGTDDGGDVTPPDTGSTTYNNGVTLDRDADTLTFDTVTLDGETGHNVTFSYAQEGDNYILTAPDGRTLVINQKYVTAGNDAVMEGTQGGTGYAWRYDSQGRFWFASADTTVIEGDGQTNTISDNTIVSGADAIGTLIFGDNTENILNGDITAGDGAIGVVVSGDGTNTTLNGDIYASGGATGLSVSGNQASVTNNGSITAVDPYSTGVEIAGNHTMFSNTGTIDSSLNGTGIRISGDDATVLLDGTVKVHEEQDAGGVYQGATGVSISGNRSDTTITGDMNLTNTSDKATGELTGLSVSGDNNTVTLDGTLALTTVYSVLDIQGIVVNGTGNQVQVNGGVNMDVTTPLSLTAIGLVSGISITGNNTVSISGHSTLNLDVFSGAGVMLASVNDGGTLILNTDSVLDINASNPAPDLFSSASTMHTAGSGSTIDNQGVINTTGLPIIMSASSGAMVSNSGTINATASSSDSRYCFGLLTATDADSVALNGAGGEINVLSTVTPIYSTGVNIAPVKWYENTLQALLAENNGTVENQAGGTISLQGAGLYGLGAAKGTAINAGTVNVDGFVPTLDENGAITDKHFWQKSGALYTMSAGVIVGSTDSGYADATGLNTGTINVNNEGFGMLALNGGTAVNQGTINLTADEGVTASASNQLIGMGVINGGTAINDQTGVINISADYGQAFYNDGSGLIVNYGTICANGNCQDSDTYNPTDNAVSVVYRSGLISEKGQTVTFGQNNAAIVGAVDNDGTVEGGKIRVTGASASLNNSATGVISSTVTMDSGTLTNAGTITARSQISGGTLTNTASGTMSGTQLTNSAILNNDGTMTLGSSAGSKNADMVEVNNTAQLNNNGTIVLDNNKNALHINQKGVINNTGTITATTSSHTGVVNINGGGGMFRNSGTVNVSGATSVVASSGNASSSTDAFFWNATDGTVNFDRDNGKAVNFSGSNYVAQNDGTLNISGNNAVGMYGDYNSQLVNNGTITLGTTGSTDTGLIAMQLGKNATADAVIENNGTININTSDSYAFSNLGSSGHIVNNGTVVFADGVTGSGLIAQPDGVVEGTNGNDGNASETHYASYTLPGSSAENSLAGYVVGTNADGSAGKLMVSNASLDGVGINTGFTAGTDATTVTFDNVVEGSNLTDADTITSTSVVWTAQGSTDTSGNVDVTMTKNAYADVTTDDAVSSVASALDAGYTNNELYTSLNVATTAELNSALKQISGSQANSVFNQARMLSNRFNMLADTAPVLNNGLAMNLVAKGDPRAELGKDTRYDMLALRQMLSLTDNQSLSLEYGVARLDGDNSTLAGDNSITGGYSQFFGLKHEMTFGNGLSWNNNLRYDVHNLDSNRAVSYDSVRKSADSSMRQQYLELRSSGAKKFELSEGLSITPYAGVKLRYTLEDGYQERNAGDFNLNMNAGSETAVDSIAGMKLNYAGKDGWSATAMLEGGPNLSYAKSQRSATLQGADSQRFNVDDGQKGGGVNSLATAGMKYSSVNSAMQLEAFHWKEDGISDKGLMLNYRYSFR